MGLLRFTNKPSILLLHTGEVGEEVKAFLVNRNENLIGAYTDISATQLATVARMAQPDLIITCYLPYLLKPEIFNIPKYGCINFHPGLLPKNRGWYPAVWPFIDGTRAGATLHLIDSGADTGSIIAQAEIEVKETYTAGDLYVRLQQLMVQLFKTTWCRLYESGVMTVEQDHSQATYHTKNEGNAFNDVTKYKEAINILKAKTFNNRSYAYYVQDGKKYYVSVKVTTNGTE